MSESLEEHFVGKVAQKALIIKDDKVMIARDVNDVSTWELPGGRLNVDELPPAGLARELFEELGVEVVVGPVVYMEQYFQSRTGERQLLIVYKVHLKDETGPLTLAPNEVAEVKWIGKADLAHHHIFDNCARALEHYFGNLD